MKVENFSELAEHYKFQKTISEPCFFSGIGLHSGNHCNVGLFPAEPNSGILFCHEETNTLIPAHFTQIVSTTHATCLGELDNPLATIRTVEHLLAVICALGITNLLIRVQGGEVPILDGSSEPFLNPLRKCKVLVQPYSSAAIRILKPIKIFSKGSICELLPRKNLRLTVSIDFPHALINSQTFAIDLSPAEFIDKVASARTFGFLNDLEKLQSIGLAKGAGLDNVVAFSDTEILNVNGLRFPDECVRHKLLDATGDLALLGAHLIGEFISFRGGHAMHLELMRAMQEQKENWELIPPEYLGSHAPLYFSNEVNAERFDIPSQYLSF